MPVSRLLAAVVVAVPFIYAAPAEARPHHPARVQTATYKVVQHKASRHHAPVHRRMAQVHRHSNMRGS